MKVKYVDLPAYFGDVELILDDFRELAKTGDYTLGKALTEFEEAFAKHHGVKHAVGVSSGTAALILSLRAFGIGSGDEVITCPLTYVATVGAIVAVGAKPVFVDSEDGYVIDSSKIEEEITDKAKAIIPVHYTGNMADMPEIWRTARRYDLKVIEDACQAVDAGIECDSTPGAIQRVSGGMAGSWGNVGCFSIHPPKNLSVWGDGGVITTNDSRLADRLRLLRNHGFTDGRDRVGFFSTNDRLDSLQALVGTRKLETIHAENDRRIAIAKRYDEAFSAISGVGVPVRRSGVRHNYHMAMYRFPDRDRLREHMLDWGVDVKIHYPIPVHLQEAAASLGYKEGDFPQCEVDCRQVLTMPCHPFLTDAAVEYVIGVVLTFYGRRYA